MAKSFVKMPVDILARKDLSLPGKIVFAAIVDCLWNKEECWPSIRALCRRVALTNKTVVRATRELEVVGLLVVDRPGPGKLNVYSLPRSGDEKRGTTAPALSTQSGGGLPPAGVGVPPTAGVGNLSTSVGILSTKRGKSDPTRRGSSSPIRVDSVRQTNKQTQEQTAAPPKKERPRNELWDAVVAEWFADGIPDSQRANVGKLVKEFRQLKATPAEIRVRRQRVLDCWGPGRDTPASTLKHWSEFANERHADKHRPGRETAAPGKYAGLGD